MRKHLTWLVAAGLILTGSAAYAQGAPRQNTRPVQKSLKTPSAPRLHIEQRIRQGVRANQLTRSEVQQLRLRLAEIRKQRLGMRADGRIGPAERAKLRQQLRQTSRALFRLRHNRIKR